MTAHRVTRISNSEWTYEDMFETSIERLVHADTEQQFTF